MGTQFCRPLKVHLFPPVNSPFNRILIPFIPFIPESHSQDSYNTALQETEILSSLCAFLIIRLKNIRLFLFFAVLFQHFFFRTHCQRFVIFNDCLKFHINLLHEGELTILPASPHFLFTLLYFYPSFLFQAKLCQLFCQLFFSFVYLLRGCILCIEYFLPKCDCLL